MSLDVSTPPDARYQRPLPWYADPLGVVPDWKERRRLRNEAERRWLRHPRSWTVLAVVVGVCAWAAFHRLAPVCLVLAVSLPLVRGLSVRRDLRQVAVEWESAQRSRAEGSV